MQWQLNKGECCQCFEINIDGLLAFSVELEEFSALLLHALHQTWRKEGWNCALRVSGHFQKDIYQSISDYDHSKLLVM